MEKIAYPDDVTLYLSEDRGVYISKVFAEVIRNENIINRKEFEKDLNFLKKYDTKKDFYWETWDQILNHLKIKIGRRTYFFCQVSPGDIWMIRDCEKVRKDFFKSIE
jgi:hypothetical protein